MDCPKTKEILGELILGSRSEVSSADRIEAQAHIKSCPDCRSEAAALERIRATFRTVDQIAEALPAEQVTALHDKILASIEDSAAIASIVPLPIYSRLRIIPAYRLAAAALVIAALGVCLLLPDREPNGEPEREPTSVAAEPAEEPLNVAILRQEFDDLKKSPTGIDEEFLLKVKDHRIKADGLDELTEAQGLLAEAYGELGETRKERDAFKSYLRFIEERDGSDTAARVAQQKADKLFHEQGDYLTGLSYYDLVLTRYPRSHNAVYAKYMVGTYYVRIKEPRRAISEYRRLMGEHPGTELGKQARREISRLYYNMGDYDEAYNEMESYRQQHTDAESHVYAHLKIGMMKYGEGVSGYPDAIKEFQSILAKYPKHHYAKSAQQMLAMINRDMMGTDLTGMLE